MLFFYSIEVLNQRNASYGILPSYLFIAHNWVSQTSLYCTVIWCTEPHKTKQHCRGLQIPELYLTACCGLITGFVVVGVNQLQTPHPPLQPNTETTEFWNTSTLHYSIILQHESHMHHFNTTINNTSTLQPCSKLQPYSSI